ncbi:MAG: aminotransferase class I/II-fold pyridoxal phosphate-dependent enzyme [Saccharofermentanales bacterium]|nr:aminotransferase class I/II-fold pyridoxal phosphate-dependent enzyme [Clostridiaceae bacterium]
MPSYSALSPRQREQELLVLNDRYRDYEKQNFNLNMTRGKPCPEQLDLSAELMTCLSKNDYKALDGTDCRNYGGIGGLPEARRLFADILGTSVEHVTVFGNSSLNLMYDILVKALLFPLPGAISPWSKQGELKFICPTPGYDRHFFVTQTLGFEMIPVPMTDEGPDMNQVESLVASDPAIKGLWLVPIYSNPQGITCSERTCERLASMPAAAPDFRIFWDNAYVVHHLDPNDAESLPDMIELCDRAGNPDRIFEFTSTSKITWAGAGIACMAGSLANLAFVHKHMAIQTIGPDKVNQLRHCRFLKDRAGVEALMAKHAKILRPKFDLVHQILEKEIADTGVCHWKKPKGGYFISLSAYPGTAKEVVRMAKACGVELTPAGNPFPLGLDPDDSNIRLAPSFPPLDELRPAINVLGTCIKIAALKKMRG